MGTWDQPSGAFTSALNHADTARQRYLDFEPPVRPPPEVQPPILPPAPADLNPVMASQANPYWGGISDVSEAYYDLLGRAPDAEGQAFWTNQQLNPADLLTAFKGSQEYKDYSAANPSTSYFPGINSVEEAYKEMMGRDPDQAGLDFWNGQGWNNDTARAFYDHADSKAYRDSDAYKSYWNTPLGAGAYAPPPATGTTPATTTPVTDSSTVARADTDWGPLWDAGAQGYDNVGGQQIPWGMGDTRWGSGVLPPATQQPGAQGYADGGMVASNSSTPQVQPMTTYPDSSFGGMSRTAPMGAYTPTAQQMANSTTFNPGIYNSDPGMGANMPAPQNSGPTQMGLMGSMPGQAMSIPLPQAPPQGLMAQQMPPQPMQGMQQPQFYGGVNSMGMGGPPQGQPQPSLLGNPNPQQQAYNDFIGQNRFVPQNNPLTPDSEFAWGGIGNRGGNPFANEAFGQQNAMGANTGGMNGGQMGMMGSQAPPQMPPSAYAPQQRPPMPGMGGGGGGGRFGGLVGRPQGLPPSFYGRR